MADTWLTIEQAALKLGLSARTVNRHINTGKLQSRLHEGRREVLVQGLADSPSVTPRAQAQERAATTETQPKAEFRTNSPSAKPEPRVEVKAQQPEHLADEPQEPEYAAAGGVNFTMGDGHRASAARPVYDGEEVINPQHDRTELVISAFQTMVRSAELQAMSRQRSARVAWAIAGTLIVGTAAAIGFATHYITRLSVTNTITSQDLAQSRQLVDKLAQENEGYRQKLVDKEEAYRAALLAAQGAEARAQGREAGFREIMAAHVIAATTRPSDTSATPATKPVTQPAATAFVPGATQPVVTAPPVVEPQPANFPSQGAANMPRPSN